MIALIQRVTEARVSVAGEPVGAIGPGSLVFAGFHTDDVPAHCARFAERIVQLRLFADDTGRMNLNLAQTGGGLLLVPQFTLAADTAKGRRASFHTAAEPDSARALFEELCAQCRILHPALETGSFQADMQVALVNDGPVSFLLHSTGVKE